VRYQFRWDVIPGNLAFLMSGLELTLIISAVTLLLSMVGGLLIAGMDMSKYRALRFLGLGIGEIIRNTPILVQLLWVYYVLPIMFNFQIEALAAAIVGLTIYSSDTAKPHRYLGLVLSNPFGASCFRRQCGSHCHRSPRTSCSSSNIPRSLPLFR
jgi:His/Glu/Gln/Arg/opine family amino acid ABC transporter permease subunit